MVCFLSLLLVSCRAVEEVQQRWDDTIHNLETKLEADLKRVERDGAQFVKPDPTNNQTQYQFDRDIGRVRHDVLKIVGVIEAAETELERLKSQLAVEQLELRQKSAKMTTEKILDDLHRGKLGVKVDYVTGELVRSRTKIHGNTTATANNITKIEQESNGVEEEEEEALEDIIEAASGRERQRKRENVVDDDAIPNEKSDLSADQIEIELNDDLKNRVKEEIESLRSGADPAILSIDFELLLDIVKLAMTAAFFGLLAVFLRLPPTAGFLFGGMLIGPSCLNVIGAIHQVQTLAQFGSIFLLFEQGLLYSQTYSGAAVLGSALATGRMEEITESAVSPPKNIDRLLARRPAKKAKAASQANSPTSMAGAASDSSHNPNIIGSIVLIMLVFSTLAIVVLTDVVSSMGEAVVVACAIAICSTTIVSENLHASHIANSQWGKGVLKIIVRLSASRNGGHCRFLTRLHLLQAMHDLFMVPLLALPELLSFLSELAAGGSDDDATQQEDDATSLHGIWVQLALIGVFFSFFTFAAKRIISAANLAQARMMGAKGELFTLSVVAYALFIASMSEKLKLSIEVGAILAGIILMQSPYVPKVLASIQPITSVFGGMYLTSLGMIISPSFVANEAGSIIKLVCLIGMFKLVLVSTVLNRLFGYGIAASLAVGSAMAQISETSLLVMAKAQRLGLVSRRTYLLFIPTICILLTMAPLSAAQLRRLKMQEVSGNDDGKIPYYLCFLRHLGILRQPHNKTSFSQSGEDLEEGHTHRAK
jgi:Kef-type K+ transport system membrane component KefB